MAGSRFRKRKIQDEPGMFYAEVDKQGPLSFCSDDMLFLLSDLCISLSH